jgi:hypothetical protein
MLNIIWVVVVNAYNPSTQEAETGGYQVQVHGQFRLHSEFKASLGYNIARPCLRNKHEI